jgi:hypothetical protein
VIEMAQPNYNSPAALIALTHLLENPVEIVTKKLAPAKRHTLAETARIRAS